MWRRRTSDSPPDHCAPYREVSALLEVWKVEDVRGPPRIDRHSASGRIPKEVTGKVKMK